MIVRIELPWPDKHLSPNARGHTKVKAQYIKAARETAYWIARSELERHVFDAKDELIITVTEYPPGKKYELDWDNLAGTCKAYQDGLFQALDLDDRQIREGRARKGAIRPPDGYVEIILERIEDDIQR